MTVTNVSLRVDSRSPLDVAATVIEPAVLERAGGATPRDVDGQRAGRRVREAIDVAQIGRVPRRENATRDEDAASRGPA